MSAAERQRVVDIVCHGAEVGEPAAARRLIATSLPVAAAKAELDRMSQIRSVVAEARQVDPTIGRAMADTFIAEGLSPADARKRLAAMSPAVADCIAADDEHGWIAAIQKENDRRRRAQ